MIAIALLSNENNRNKIKQVAKGGVHKDTWKSDLKTIAKSKKEEDRSYAHNHKSVPLSSLTDPDAFGPPPKRGTQSSIGTTTSSTQLAICAPPSQTTSQPPSRSETPSGSGLQLSRIASTPPPQVPYRADTTGLRTDNLPRPVRRTEAPSALAPSVSSPFPSLPPRQPPRQQQPEVLPPIPTRARAPPPPPPPRQNEYPTEYTPPAPPPYKESFSVPQANPAMINAGAVRNLKQAGISVPAFEIGTTSRPSQLLPQRAPQNSPQIGPQLSELEQRFARMAARSEVQTPFSPQATVPQTTEAQTTTIPTAAGAAAQKKKPPPPPPKKKAALSNITPNVSAPPVPMGSKPRS